MKSNYFYLFILFLFSNSLFSQEYKPIDTADFVERKLFLESYKFINESYQKSLKSKNPGTTGREMAKEYAAFQEKFSKEIQNKDYLFKSKFSDGLNNYFAQLRKEEGAEQIKIIVSRDNTPNAFCIQDGVFIVNMGLFNWLDNQEQFTAILAHELGHKLMTHSEKWQKKRIEKDLNLKSQVQEITGSKINITDKAFKIFKGQIYESTAYKRKNESEADSIGYVMYAKTGLKKAEYINALRNLQKFDTISPVKIKKELYSQLFNLPDHPFKEKWLKSEDFSGYNYENYKEKLNKDSLATHPEVEARIAYLKKIFPELKEDQDPIESKEGKFLELQKIAKYEILPNYFQSEDYGLGIYSAMQFLQENGTSDYYRNWLGRNFQKIYEARKNYTLNRYLDRINPKDQSESYQQFLNFMWNLSLEDIKNISEFYAPKTG